eukprot:scaffold8171_cov269-Prasinococcus_capsulatus_cf.AAC.2
MYPCLKSIVDTHWQTAVDGGAPAGLVTQLSQLIEATCSTIVCPMCVDTENGLDIVIAALNLYRYVLLREKALGRSVTGVLERDSLLRAHTKWLPRLRQALARLHDWCDAMCKERGVGSHRGCCSLLGDFIAPGLLLSRGVALVHRQARKRLVSKGPKWGSIPSRRFFHA